MKPQTPRNIGIFNTAANSLGVFGYLAPFISRHLAVLALAFLYCFIGLFVGLVGLLLCLKLRAKPEYRSWLYQGIIWNLVSYIPYAIWLVFLWQGFVLLD
jgi:hypothetical protein